ncbi:ketol-acid reductoisomerase [Anaerolineales bacterium]
MTIIYRDDDANLAILEDKVVGVIGYGSMGRPFALNLHDTGIQVLVGVRSEATAQRVHDDGLRATTIEAVVQATHILLLMLPDEVMAQVYIEKIAPYLQRGHTLIFASGYNIAAGFIEAPPFVDVGVIAPRTIGETARERYLSGQGFYSFIAVGQDASGTVWHTVLAIAKAIGTLRAGAVETTIEQEMELDQFMQQAILPAVHHILVTAAQLLLEYGYPPEAAMMDLYVSGELSDYIDRVANQGLLHALRMSNLTAQFGIFSRLERFRELKMERLMEVTLNEIRQGKFAHEWAKEYAEGYPRLKRLLKDQEDLSLWDLEQQTIDYLKRDDDF